MWITFCQENNEDQTRQVQMDIVILFCYTTFMERLTKNKKIKAKRKYGFRARMETKGGRDVLKRRKQKERTRLSA